MGEHLTKLSTDSDLNYHLFIKKEREFFFNSSTFFFTYKMTEQTERVNDLPCMSMVYSWNEPLLFSLHDFLLNVTLYH